MFCCGVTMTPPVVRAVGSKIKALLASLQDMAAADPQAKAVVFSQFSKTHSATVKALQGAGLVRSLSSIACMESRFILSTFCDIAECGASS